LIAADTFGGAIYAAARQQAKDDISGGTPILE
jgi:hypothetical protein